MTMKRNPYSILVVDDEATVRDSLGKWFIEEGYDVSVAENGSAALDILSTRSFDVIFLDIKMPGMSGLELQRKIREFSPNAIIVIITAFASVDTAVEALKDGAHDYITKPIDPDYLSHMVSKLVKQKEMAAENAELKERVSEMTGVSRLVGSSPAMKKVHQLIATVAPTDTTVMIRGESGTGKELIARAIHAASPRRYHAIVPINCGGLTETLLESELFGHERGAFTGAQFRRKGHLEMADGGTAFFDEIGNVGPKIQMDLLRVIESKEFFRVGGNTPVKSDFRIISATNRDLEAAVKSGDFREDLYYRLNVFTIEVPPLRDRGDDILTLAQHFLDDYARTMNRPFTGFTDDAIAAMRAHSWPGNVRELENAIERAVVVGTPPLVTLDDLPIAQVTRDVPSDELSLEALEQRHIQRVLQMTDGNVTKAAQTLGIDRATLYNKIKKYNLTR
ncbi:MAG: sigma 54-interacting transcriptional regulator [Candidatus Zixiibacteriota bacterium]